MKIAKQSQSFSVFERLRRDILWGDVSPGTKLVIDQLCVDYGTSLGAIREALSRLASDGLTTFEPFKGYTVASISPQDLRDLTAARISIERLCLEESLVNGDLVWESRLVALEHRLARVPQFIPETHGFNDEWAALHGELHDALAEACANRWLLRFRGILYERTERYRRLALMSGHHHRNVRAEHAEIVSAAIRRDVETACDLLAAHISRTTETIFKAFGWKTCDDVSSPETVAHAG